MFHGRKFTRSYGFVAVLLLLSVILAACGGGGGNTGGGSGSQPAATSGTTPSTSQPSGSATSSSSNSSTVTLAMTSAWQGMQPYNVVGLYTTVLFDNIYDRLIYLNREMEYEPRLASRWEMNETFDEMTFYLQENAKWHDGEPVTVDDILFTIDISTNPDTVLQSRQAFLHIKGTTGAGIAESGSVAVEKIDDHTFTVKLKEPMDEGTFLNSFARNFWVLPKHLLGDVAPADLDKQAFWRSPVGTGPFKFVREVEGQFVELTRNEDYFLGSPKFEKLVVSVVPQTSIAAGLQTGDIDVLAGFGMGDVPLEDWETVQEMAHVVAESHPTLTTQFVAVNTERPYLADARVRRALSMAINRQSLIDNLFRGEGVVARGPYAPVHGYFDPTVPEIPYDPDGARALLEEAGFDFNRELVVTVPTGNVQRERSGALIQQDFQRIGVKLRIQQMDFTTALTQTRAGDFDLALMGGAGSPDPDMTGLLHPSGATSLSRHRIPEIMTPIEEGLKGLTFEERKVHYDELQRQIQEFSPYLYMYHDNSLIAYNKRMKNVPVADFLWYNFGTWKWEIQ